MPMVAVAQYELHAGLAALLIGGGLSLVVVALLLRVRSRQRSLAAILDDTMGQARVPVEVASEAPPRNETSALTVRLGQAMGRLDTRGTLEQRLERADIPFRSGEYLVMVLAAAIVIGGALGFLSGLPVVGIAGLALVAIVAWRLPMWRSQKRSQIIEEQLPDALSLMAASVEGGQTFQRAIDMYRHDARPPLSVEFDRVMAEVTLGADLVVALQNMADRAGVEDLKWAVEAVRIQQSTGGRLAPILHTLADFMRTRQEVRREVRTLSAEGRISGYVLFALPIFLLVAISLLDPKYLQPMFHGVGLVVLIGTGGLMALGYAIVRQMVNIEV
ncbi:MAG: type II secretion system F family protein [Acidimicrobiales bacterium]